MVMNELDKAWAHYVEAYNRWAAYEGFTQEDVQPEVKRRKTERDEALFDYYMIYDEDQASRYDLAA
jgi:hypothetical protein